MPSISEILGASAVPHEFEFNGRLIRLSLITQKTKSELERWLYQKHIKSVQEAREFIDPAEYSAMLNEAIKRHGAGEFSWGGSAMRASMAGPPAMAKLMSLISIDPATKSPVPADELEKAFTDPAQQELIVAHYTTILDESNPAAKKKVTGTEPLPSE